MKCIMCAERNRWGTHRFIRELSANSQVPVRKCQSPSTYLGDDALMENIESVSQPPTVRPTRRYQWVAAVLLVVVGYIHLALFVNMFGFTQTLGKLFLLNAIGAFVAAAGVLWTRRWYAWALGIVVSGGAAFAKLGMSHIPALGALLTGGRPGRFGGVRPSGSFRTGGSRAFAQRGTGGGGIGSGGAHNFANGGPGPGRFGPPGGHSLLPVFLNVRSLATGSIVIELAFVVLALYILFVRKRVTQNV